MPRIDANEIIRVHLCNSMTKTTWKGRIKAMRILPTNLHEWTRMMVDVFLIRVNSCGFVDKKTVCQNNLGFPLKGRIKAMMVLPTNLHEFTRMMVNGFWIRVNSCGFVGKKAIRKKKNFPTLQSSANLVLCTPIQSKESLGSF